jgi:hypothetical protein
VKVSSSWNYFKLGRVIEMSLTMYLLFWQRVMEQSKEKWQGLIEYRNKIVWKPA